MQLQEPLREPRVCNPQPRLAQASLLLRIRGILQFWLYLCLVPAQIILGSGNEPTKPTGTNPPGEQKKSIVILGDSLAAGYGLDPSEAFPAILQRRIDAANLPFQVVNAGLSGDTTAGGLRRIDWLLKRPVDVLLLELGGNDGLRGISVASTRTNLQTIIQKTRARYPQAKIVIAGMEMPPNMGAEFQAAFQAIFPEVARAHQAILIPFLLENVGGKPDLNLPDMIHPTAKGHEIVADNVWKILAPVLKDTLQGSVPKKKSESQ